MATFFNRATLSYNGMTATSNTVSGEIVGSVTATKTALTETYAAGDTVTYAINLINSSSSESLLLTLTDNLGAYPFGGGQVVPLTYVQDSIKQFTNGVQVTPVTVASESPLTVNNITVPAGGVVTVIYQATVNEFAPLTAGSQITNVATLTSPLLGDVATASETITVATGTMLSIEKALSPLTVSPNGQITYTFTVRNSGTTAAVAADNLSITDTFEPVLSGLTVTYNGTPLSEGTGYTYDGATGLFNTVPGVITVPAATYTQDPVTGEWSGTPGVAVVTVTGTI